MFKFDLLNLVEYLKNEDLVELSFVLLVILVLFRELSKE